jgi:carbon monoxide dehydrogenase subunit G
MHIETDKVSINKSAQEIFNFLENMNNFEQLLQNDKIEKVKTTDDTCEFTIKGMATIGLKTVNKISPEKISIESFGKVPFNFNMDIHIKPINDNSCEAYLTFDGKINPFMKMMVEKPMTNFLNMLAHKLAEIHN